MLFDPLTRHFDFLGGWGWPLLHLAWIVGGTVFLLLHERRPVTTLGWLFAFWLVPILSGVAYFLFGPRKLDRQKGARQGAMDRARQCAPERDEHRSEAFEQRDLSAIGRVTRAGSQPSVVPRRAQSVTLYRNGEELYPAMLATIEQASETLNLEYYIWQPDGIGTRLRDALARRASEGVRVCVLTDSIGAKNCDREFWEPLERAGAELRTFNPPRLLAPQPGKMNFRTHRKILVADGRIGFVGGINIADDNTCGEAGRGNEEPWRSTHARLEGYPVRDLQRVLLADWLYGLPLDRVRAGGRTAEQLLGAGMAEMPRDVGAWFPAHEEPEQGPWVQIVDSGPDEESLDIRNLYLAAITEARSRLWITTPYFVPDEPIETALRSAAARGVEVRLIIPEQNDSMLVKAAAWSYSSSVAETGVEVYLFQHLMNHSKTLLVDDDFSIVGTANMDNRSFRLNFEVVAAIWDEGINRELAALFTQDLARSRRFDPQETDVDILTRLWRHTARLLSPLL